ncbi:MAG TPA: GNAT family N-acetyltransferase [Thermomicrobiales bacterium]
MQDDRGVVTIDEWPPDHPRWPEVLAAVAALGQEAWVAATAPWHRSAHLLVALHGGALVGFLRFVVQAIGPELGRPPVILDGQTLTEAKVLAFGVLPESRGRGIGRALQEAVIARATELGCHQVRSHSGGSNVANHRLKLSLGFGIHPIVRGEDTTGAYFILPLGGRRRA